MVDRQRNSSANDETSDTGRHSICCQLQLCNLVLAVLGALGLGLAGTQFEPRIGIDDYRQIDLRLSISLFLSTTGIVGFYCVGRSFGSIVLKTLYIICATLALGGAVFYGFTTYKVTDLHRQLVHFEQAGGQFTGAFGVARTSSDFVPKTIISSVMAGVCLLGFFAGLISLVLLDRLVVVERPWYPALREDQIRANFNKTLLGSVAFIKMLVGIATLGLATFVEFEHTIRLALRQDYFRVVLDQLSALFAVASAIADLYAVYTKLHGSLSLKVSIALSVAASVWCLKSVDNNAFPFYKQDITQYRVAEQVAQSTFGTISPPQYAIVIVHGLLLGALALLALLCAASAILAAGCLRECIAKRYEEFGLRAQNRSFLLLHSFWALCLISLALLGMANLPWNGDFVGSDLLWLAVLVCGTGVLGSTNARNSTVVKFVMNTISFALCVEKALFSVNLVFQSVTHPDYVNEAIIDARTRVGQISLYSAQCLVLVCESLTALCGAVVYGRVIKERLSRVMHSNALHCCASLAALLYGAAFIASEVFFELDKWRWSEVMLEQSSHYRIGNGPLGLAVFVVQAICCSFPQFLVAAVLLQLILSSLALFALNSAITNLYYLQILLNVRSAIGLSNHQRTLILLGISFTAAAVVACGIQLIFGTISILRSSYLLHRGRTAAMREDGDVLGYYNAAASVDDQWNGAVLSIDTLSRHQSPALHQIAIQPIEEQTLYWSAEDNPYIYKSTKRVFGQPILGVEARNDESGYGGSPSPQFYFYSPRRTNRANEESVSRKLQRPSPHKSRRSGYI